MPSRGIVAKSQKQNFSFKNILYIVVPIASSKSLETQIGVTVFYILYSIYIYHGNWSRNTQNQFVTHSIYIWKHVFLHERLTQNFERALATSFTTQSGEIREKKLSPEMRSHIKRKFGKKRNLQIARSKDFPHKKFSSASQKKGT